MQLSVREVDPREESERLLTMLERALEGWGGRSKFEWLYLDNPAGPARTWVLEDASGDLLGVSSAFPRILRSERRSFHAWVLGDFCVERSHRTLGPAIKLQRAVFDAVNHGDVELCYDFPSRVMAAVYRRMGVRSFRKLERFVRPLSLERWVERKLGAGAVAKGLAAIGNTVLRAQETKSAKDASFSVRSWDGTLEEEVELESALSEGVRVERSRAYLDWRYRRHPGGELSMLVAERNGLPAGFLVAEGGEDELGILDACGTRAAMRELVLQVLDAAREEGLATVSMGLSEGHPYIEIATELGFQRRDHVPYVVYGAAGVSEEAEPWYLMNGDRDA